MNMTQSLPIAVRIPCIATSEPSASPSGFSCVTTISLSARAQLVEHLLAGGAVAVLSSCAGLRPIARVEQLA